MRRPALAAAALLALSSIGFGQVIPRRPPIDRRPTPPPAALPPDAAPVARALAYRRSRWSAEAYSMVSSIDVPMPGGGSTRYATLGSGTQGDYRFTDRVSATLDLTMSPFWGSAITETGEIGARYRPAPLDANLRPFFDVRTAYMHMYDTFFFPGAPPGGVGQQMVQEGRYSQGVGSVAGAGLEYSLTRSLALTTELSAMRSRMTTYRLTNPTSVPDAAGSYWMTSLRYMFGLKYNPVRALKLVQKATP